MKTQKQAMQSESSRGGIDSDKVDLRRGCGVMRPMRSRPSASMAVTDAIHSHSYADAGTNTGKSDGGKTCGKVSNTDFVQARPSLGIRDDHLKNPVRIRRDNSMVITAKAWIRSMDAGNTGGKTRVMRDGLWSGQREPARTCWLWSC